MQNVQDETLCLDEKSLEDALFSEARNFMNKETAIKPSSMLRPAAIDLLHITEENELQELEDFLENDLQGII